jgi:hypothetical protein
MMEEYNDKHPSIDATGPILLSCELPVGEELISAWAGARLTLMMDDKGRDILRLKIGLPFNLNSSEEE